MAVSNRDYWAERFKQLEASQNQSSRALTEEMELQMRKAEAAINSKINAWYGRLASNNNVSMDEARRMLDTKELEEFRWELEDYIRYGKKNAINGQWMRQLENASARVHISYLEQLKLQVQQEAERLYGNCLDQVDQHVRALYEDGFYRTAYEIQKGLGYGGRLAAIDAEKLDKIIKRPWAADGRNFSERIWSSKQRLIDQVHTSLTQMCILGQGPDKAIRDLAKAMKTSRNQAGRLIMTESAFFSSTAQKDCFNDLGVEEYEIVATLDSHTSDICQIMDGQHFPMSEYKPGATAPPFHVWCRSCTCPYFDDEFSGGMRAARGEDGKTYYVDSRMTYPEWKRQFVASGNQADTKKKMKEILDHMSSHEPVSIYHIKSKYRDDIIAVIDQAPENIRRFIETHKDEIVSVHENAISGFREIKQGMFLNLKTDLINPRGTWTSTFHEIGHRVDRVAGRISGDKLFEEALRNDFNQLVKSYETVYNVSEKVAYKEIGKIIRDPKAHSVSDLFGGMSGNKCIGIYGHRDLDYWNRKGQLGKEAFAHFFEATARRDIEKLDILKQTFPSAYPMFEKMLGELE